MRPKYQLEFQLDFLYKEKKKRQKIVYYYALSLSELES